MEELEITMSVKDGDYHRVTVSYSLPQSSIMQNVFDLRWSEIDPGAEPTDGQAVTAIKGWLDVMYGYLEPYLSTALSTFEIAVDEITWDDIKKLWEIVRRVGEETLTLTPAGATDVLPVQNAALVTYDDGIYRDHKAKKFIGGLVEGDNTATGVMGAALIAALADFSVTGLLNVIISSAGDSMYADYVALDRAYGGYYLLKNGTITGRWSGQRRRKWGVGA